MIKDQKIYSPKLIDLRKKNLMTFFIIAEKAFDKIQYTFLIKLLIK